MRWELLLAPLTPAYAAAVALRGAAYEKRWLPVHRLALPVVSVGNLSFGGTGKTPLTIALVRDLIHRGRRPAVLTRGYGRRLDEPVVVLGPETKLGPEEAGDEPLEMAARLPGVPIVVDADRVAGGRLAARHEADILVLDDGFQHRRLARDLDLVVVDGADPWSGGRLPPRGRLREPLTALARADALIVNKLGRQAEEILAAVRARAVSLAPGLPVLGARMVPRRVWFEESWQEPDILRGRRVLAFAGLGRPESFAELLESAGAEVVRRRWFPDHHPYTPAELAALRAEAARHQLQLVTTAKDRVKLPGSQELAVVETAVEPLAGSWQELWNLLPGENA